MRPIPPVFSGRFGWFSGLQRFFVPAGIVLDTSPKTLALFGDSISFQNHGAVTNRYEANGYANACNVLMGQRFTCTKNENKGVSGNSTTQMAGRLSDLDGLGADAVAVLGGTNDASAITSGNHSGSALVTHANSIRDTIIANLGTCYDYVNDTLGVMVLALVIGPRSFWSGATAEQITEGKRVINEVNDWIRAQAAINRILVIDYYDDWDDGNDEPLADFTFDGLHPLYKGAFWMGYRMREALLPYWGDYDYALSADNTFSNTTFSGTGGTISASHGTGQLATGWVTEGSGGNSADCTFSKDADGKQLIDFASATVATITRRIYQQYTAGDLVGKTAYCEFDVEVIEANAGTGSWYSFSAELRNSAELSIGYDRRNAGDRDASQELYDFTVETGRRLLIRSPAVVCPDPTASLRGRLNLECVNDSGESFNMIVKLHNVQLVVTS